MADPERDLEPPAVSPDVYDEDYYRNACGGFEEWSKSGGAEVWALYPHALDRAHLQPGDLLVDIGAGRGELVAVAVERSAGRAIGIEYSAAAVSLASKT